MPTGNSSPCFVPGACNDIAGRPVYSLFSVAASCFIWTFLTGIALNCARWGAFWPPLKAKYLPVFSLAGAQPSPASSRWRRRRRNGAPCRNLLYFVGPARHIHVLDPRRWFPLSPSGFGPSGLIDSRFSVSQFSCCTNAVNGPQEFEMIPYSCTVCAPCGRTDRGPVFIKCLSLFGSVFFLSESRVV